MNGFPVGPFTQSDTEWSIVQPDVPNITLHLNATETDASMELTIDGERQFIIHRDGTFSCHWESWRPWRRRSAKVRAARGFMRCIAAQSWPLETMQDRWPMEDDRA